jgi:4-amino-4-deoxy-L-arabinose transferase-like glycosyltransferase
LFALALVARLAFVAVLPPRPLWTPPHDTSGYMQMGQDLAEHGTYGRQTIRPPGYPTFIAAVYRVFGENLVALRVVESVLGAIAALGLALLGAGLFGRTPGILTGLLAALHPVMAFMPSTQFSENFTFAVMVATLGIAFAAIRSGGLWRWLLTGLVLGIGTLSRANVFIFFPGFALGAAVWLWRERRPWALPLLLTGLTMALCVTPWIIRNHRMWNRWYFVSTGGGRQLYFGNNPYTDCRTALGALPDSAIQAELDRLPNTFAQDSLYYRRAWDFIGSHPGRAAQLYLIKLGNMYALFPDPLNQKFLNLWSRVAQGIASVVIFLGALLGLSRWRREPALWPMVLGTLSFSAATAMVFSSLRYRLVIEPCLMLIAGLGWSLVLQRFAPPSRVRTTAPR